MNLQAFIDSHSSWWIMECRSRLQQPTTLRLFLALWKMRRVLLAKESTQQEVIFLRKKQHQIKESNPSHQYLKYHLLPTGLTALHTTRGLPESKFIHCRPMADLLLLLPSQSSGRTMCFKKSATPSSLISRLTQRLTTTPYVNSSAACRLRRSLLHGISYF